MNQKCLLLVRVCGDETLYNAWVPADSSDEAAELLRQMATATLDFELKLELVDPVTGKQRMVLAQEIEPESVQVPEGN